MTSAQLKVLACLFMLIDHIGVIIYPDIITFRIIGRLAFPIFVFFIVEGFLKTRDITLYLGRLTIFAIISQFAFSYAFNTSSLNVLYTFIFGLLSLYIHKKNNDIKVVFLLALIAQLVDTDYGAFGVILIFIFYKFYQDRKKLIKYFTIIVFLFSLLTILFDVFYYKEDLSSLLYSPILYEPICLASLILINHYNGKKGANLKYLFYIFYPLHLVILRLIQIYLL
ncbi:TraX family protein [Caldicellulosiruptoraceae bacterium PP1]